MKRSIVIVVMLLVSLALVIAPIASAAPADQTGVTSHTVQRGETLRAIAARYGVTVQALMQVNSIRNPDVIRAGTKLTIPRASTTSRTLTTKATPTPSVRAMAIPAAPSSACTNPYIVRRGDTLVAIAGRCGVKVSDLQRWNEVGTIIRVGQSLRTRSTTTSSASIRNAVTPAPAPKTFVPPVSVPRVAVPTPVPPRVLPTVAP